MLKNTKLPFSHLPVCFLIIMLHKHHQFLFTVQNQKQPMFTTVSFFISSNLIACGEAKGDFCSITLQTVWKLWIYHIISSSSSPEFKYMERILKSMPFTQNVKPYFWPITFMFWKMPSKTLYKWNSAVVLKVLYTKFHFYTINTFRTTENFPQKRGHQHRKLQCSKNRHQTSYLEINTRFPMRQSYWNKN